MQLRFQTDYCMPAGPAFWTLQAKERMHPLKASCQAKCRRCDSKQTIQFGTKSEARRRHCPKERSTGCVSQAKKRLMQEHYQGDTLDCMGLRLRGNAATFKRRHLFAAIFWTA